jgi:hypothetical protein
VASEAIFMNGELLLYLLRVHVAVCVRENDFIF